MTENRRRQLTEVAQRFNTSFLTVALLAGEVPGARVYEPKEGELSLPRNNRPCRATPGYDIKVVGRGSRVIDPKVLDEFDLSWAEDLGWSAART